MFDFYPRLSAKSKNISLVYTINVHTCFHLHLLIESASAEDSKPSSIKKL